MDADELAKTIERLGARYVQEYTRGMERYSAYLNSLARSESPQTEPAERAAEMQRRYAEYLLAEAPRVLTSITQAGIEYYTALASFGTQAMNKYVEQVLKAAPSTHEPRPSPATPAPTTLFFHGERGKSASNAFLVTNNRDAPIEVAFDVAEITSEDGKTRFKPRTTFDPSRCTLAPQAQQVVRCSLVLDDHFASRQAHRGSIQVVGFPDMAMPISVEVEEPVGDREASAAEPDRLATRERPPSRKTRARKKSAARKTSKKKRAARGRSSG